MINLADSQEYYIYEHCKEFERQALQAQIMHQQTLALLNQVGIQAESQILDIGCGSGELLFSLAQQVGPTGMVLGLDRDPNIIHFNQSRIVDKQQAEKLHFRVGMGESFEDRIKYDITYSRFLLAHNRNPIRILSNMCRYTLKYGHVVLEDVDILTMRAEPWSKELEEFKVLLYMLLKLMGCNGQAGLRLEQYMDRMGLHDIRVVSHQPYGAEGAIKEFPYRALQGIKHLLLKTGISTHEQLIHMEYKLKELSYDSSIIFLFPRIYQAVGMQSV